MGGLTAAEKSQSAHDPENPEIFGEASSARSDCPHPRIGLVPATSFSY